MTVVAERFEDLQGVAKAANWRGRSGRFYGLEALALAQFSLEGTDIFLLVSGGEVLWVGTENEIVSDPARRTDFRLALQHAGSAFRIPAPDDEIDRMTLMWDLEGGEPALDLSLE